MRVIKNLSILSKLSFVVILELLSNQVILRELISYLLIVLQDFTALIPIQINRCLMSRGGGQVEAAVLIVSIAHHGPTTATGILIFGKVFVRALWKEAVDGTRSF